MGRLSLLLFFYWLLLFENGLGLNILLIDLGMGMEIRLSLILKLVFLLINLLILIHFRHQYRLPKYLLILGTFLFLSTTYVLTLNPAGFLAALSINLHVLLMLNIVLYIRYNAFDLQEIKRFMQGLRVFALFNALLVIISYFYPDLLSVFESGTSKMGVNRAFGIMGDEVSVFLTFFLYEAMVFRRPVQGLIYAMAIWFTAGLGASFTALLLLFYHVIFVMKKTKFNLYLSAFIAIPLIVLSTIFVVKNQESGLVKRVSNTLNNSASESAGLRLLSFSVASEMIKEKPLLGYGFGNYRNSVIEKYEPKFLEADRLGFFRGSARVIMTSTFNPYLQMIAETGIIGLLVFVWFLVQLYKSTRIEKNEDKHDLYLMNRSSRAWLLIFLISTLSANWFLPSSFLFLLVVSLVGINHKLKELQVAELTEEAL
jgi:O-antigen ligase